MSEDWIAPTVGGLFVAALIGGLGFAAHWRYKHPCVAYQAVYVEAWTEIVYQRIDCGRDCSLTIPIPEHHPAHWEQQCIAYGNRDTGDVEAGPAPIPAERPW